MVKHLNLVYYLRYDFNAAIIHRNRGDLRITFKVYLSALFHLWALVFCHLSDHLSEREIIYVDWCLVDVQSGDDSSSEARLSPSLP